MKAPPLVLGTAALGMPYGVRSRGIVPDDEVVAALLEAAVRLGVAIVDTAPGYGDAQARLGRAGVAGRLEVVTKVPGMPVGHDARTWVRRSVEASLGDLRVDRVHAVLCHAADDLLRDDSPQLFEALIGLIDDGLADRIGISAYDPSEVPDGLLELGERALVQAPGSIMDRRVASQLAAWRRRDVEVHVRSVFLQGVLLLPAGRRPRSLERFHSELAAADAWIAAHPPAAHACLRGALELHPDALFVVGCRSSEELEDLVDAAAAGGLAVPDNLAARDRDLLEPARW